MTVRKPVSKPVAPTKKAAPVKRTAPVKKVAPRKVGVATVKKEKSVQEPTSHASAGHAYVPSPLIAEMYVPRKINGVWDAEVARKARQYNKSVLLMGPTGSGKTLFGHAFASLEQIPYYSLPCDVSLDTTALMGKYVPTDVPGKFRWQDGPVTTLWRGPCGLGGDCDDPECVAGVLNISEVNFMTPKIAAAIFSALDDRRSLMLLAHEGEIVTAHRGLLVIADMNPNYRGTQDLNVAFKNRWAVKVNWDYDTSVEESLVKSPTLREIARKVRAMVGVEVNTPVSTNMMIEFENFAKDADLGLDFAIGNFVCAFDADEQKSVFDLFDISKQNLERDFKFQAKSSTEDEDIEDFEDEDFVFEIEV